MGQSDLADGESSSGEDSATRVCGAETAKAADGESALARTAGLGVAGVEASLWVSLFYFRFHEYEAGAEMFPKASAAVTSKVW